MLTLDHLAVAAATLNEGRIAVESALGVSLQQGGEHAYFGTHNLLLGLEDGLYLEVIAINPDAPSPPYARWFDLDRFEGAPRLSNWICRSGDLLPSVGHFSGAGTPVALERGSLRWQMAVPEDGVLPFDNMFPALMQWHGREHPAQMLRPSGCRLQRLIVSHPQADELRDVMTPALQDTRVVYETGVIGLSAEIATPDGATRLL